MGPGEPPALKTAEGWESSLTEQSPFSLGCYDLYLLTLMATHSCGRDGLCPHALKPWSYRCSPLDYQGSVIFAACIHCLSTFLTENIWPYSIPIERSGCIRRTTPYGRQCGYRDCILSPSGAGHDAIPCAICRRNHVGPVRGLGCSGPRRLGLDLAGGVANSSLAVSDRTRLG